MPTRNPKAEDVQTNEPTIETVEASVANLALEYHNLAIQTREAYERLEAAQATLDEMKAKQ